MSSKSRPWLIKNAVMAWLHNYAELEKGELTKDYQALYNILDTEYESYLDDEQPTTTETRKRGRAAKRARPKKASSDTSSTEKDETTNQET